MDIDGAIEMLEEVFGSFDAVDGIPLANLHDATRHLTVALPEALETLYRRTGRSGRLHHGHGHLVAPSDLKVASGHLLIYIENQSASVFGIPIGEHASDPPVDISFEPDLAGATWERAFERFSHFVAVQGAWQAIRGGVQASALVTATTIPGIVRRLRAPREEVCRSQRSSREGASRRWRLHDLDLFEVHPRRREWSLLRRRCDGRRHLLRRQR